MNKSSSNSSCIQQKAIELYKTYPKSDWHPGLVSLLKNNEHQNWGIACSGGADSVFLLLLIFAAYPQLREKITVLHYNHRLRGADSFTDQTFVKELSFLLNLKFKTKNGPVKMPSDEGSLRNHRRSFFTDSIAALGGTILLQGHNLDDIAETLLWRIPRGVGVEGLCSPRPIEKFKEFWFVRPLLNRTRGEIRQKLKKFKIQWREDKSNESGIYLRNRLRKNTLVKWKADSDRDLMKGVKRTRELMNEQYEALESFTRLALKESLSDDHLLVEKLSIYPKAIVRKVLTIWISGQSDLEKVHQSIIDQALDYFKKRIEFKIDLSPTVSLLITKDKIFLKKKSSASKNWGILSLPLKTKVQLPTGFKLWAEKINLAPKFQEDLIKGKVQQEHNCYLSCNFIAKGLFFRQRKIGDKYNPLGINGTKKVKKSMIDQKWNDYKKNNTPIVTSKNEEILWIPGLPPDQSTLIETPELEVIRLTYTRFETL